MIVTKTWNIMHFGYYKICMFIVAYFIAVRFKKILVSAPWRWRDNSTETCKSYLRDYTHKL
jgi:hypothetical protein